MEDNKLKNIVVLKNLPSNIVDEAIVVLKHNKVKLPEYSSNENVKNNKENSKDYILNEAQMVLSDYFEKLEPQKKSSKKANVYLEKKCKRLQICMFVLAFIAIAGIIF